MLHTHALLLATGIVVFQAWAWDAQRQDTRHGQATAIGTSAMHACACQTACASDSSTIRLHTQQTSNQKKPMAITWTRANLLHMVYCCCTAAVLQVSGEALQGKQEGGIDPEVLEAVAQEVAEAVKHGVKMSIVVSVRQ